MNIPTATSTGEWLTRRRAAAILGVTQRRLEQIAAAGHVATRKYPAIPATYRAADVRRLAQQAERPSHAVMA